MHPTMNNIGAYLKGVLGISPIDSAAGAVNGPWVDRLGYGSCVLIAQCGAATGAPSAESLDSKLQSADDSSGTNGADITGAAITQLVADNGFATVNVSLSSARRWIRAVNTVGLTGGTSPKLPHSASIMLGGAQELPAA